MFVVHTNFNIITAAYFVIQSLQFQTLILQQYLLSFLICVIKYNKDNNIN